jgi:hypothetical protein
MEDVVTIETNALRTVIDDMLRNCGRVEPGQKVLIVAAYDGLAGGHNIVDRETVDLIFNGAQRLRADPAVLWLDMTLYNRTQRVVPSILEHAVAGSDIVVACAQDLSWEENVEFRQLLRTHKVPVIRNMTTTLGMLSSPWGQFPYELVAQIRFAIGSVMKAGEKFHITHPNGTDVAGEIALPLPGSSFSSFTQRRSNDLYRPFPEGVYVPMSTAAVDGQLVFDSMMPSAAYYMGVPFRFNEPVKVMIKDRYVRKVEGGAEAKALEAFLAASSKEFGEEVYNTSGFHGGVHPYASLSPETCASPLYREFVEHHHISSVHFHMAGNVQRKDIGHRMQFTAEVRGTDFRVGNVEVLKRGKSCALEDPEVLKVASRYMHVPCVRDLFAGAPYRAVA